MMGDNVINPWLTVWYYQVERQGKRKKKSAPKNDDGSLTKSNNVEKKQKKDPQVNDIEQTKCNRTNAKKLSFAEKKDKLKRKRKEKMRLVKQQRLENPDSEENRHRLEKLKAKRKAKRLKKAQEKQLKSEIDGFVAEKQDALKRTLKGCSEAITEQATVPSEEEKVESTECEDVPEAVTEQTNTAHPKDFPKPIEPVSLSLEEKEAGKAWLNLDVCEPIVKGLLELGFHTPTDIQQACIPSGLLKYKVCNSVFGI